MKRCPYCAEKIQDTAVICRYCGKALPESSVGAPSSDQRIWKNPAFLPIAISAIFVVGLIIGRYALVRQGVDEPAQPTAAATASPSGQSTRQPAAIATLDPVRYYIPTDGFHSSGPADAAIVIVEFGDYQDPYSAAWHKQTFQPLMAAYQGKIRFVFRNYPLVGIHQNALMGAEAALCAGDQNGFWGYHDTLFGKQNRMNNQQAETVGTEEFVSWAADLGLNSAAFRTCLASGKFRPQIEADIHFANSLPTWNDQPAVGGVPTFFINETRVVGAYPLSVFRQIIDAQLAALH